MSLTRDQRQVLLHRTLRALSDHSELPAALAALPEDLRQQIGDSLGAPRRAAPSELETAIFLIDVELQFIAPAPSLDDWLTADSARELYEASLRKQATQGAAHTSEAALLKLALRDGLTRDQAHANMLQRLRNSSERAAELLAERRTLMAKLAQERAGQTDVRSTQREGGAA